MIDRSIVLDRDRPQKAMAGPAGACALLTGERVWELVARNPMAPRDSILSLSDLRERWTGAGREVLPFGMGLWVVDDAQAAAVATLARPPHGGSARELLDRVRLPAPVQPAPGSLADDALRVLHNGPAASLEAVLITVAALGDALARGRVGADVEGALAAAESAWAQSGRDDAPAAGATVTR